MATASQFSDRGLALVRTFRAAFSALSEHKSDVERTQINEIIANHLRSSAPMALLGTADVLEPTSEVIVPLQDGARIDLTIDEGTLVMYVVEASGKDAAVPLSAGRAEDLRRGLARMIGGAK
jgi:hypothetical protein